jgi:hypothetical protein
MSQGSKTTSLIAAPVVSRISQAIEAVKCVDGRGQSLNRSGCFIIRAYKSSLVLNSSDSYRVISYVRIRRELDDSEDLWEG